MRSLATVANMESMPKQLTLAALLVSATLPALAGDFFCCQLNGRRACGDTLPTACRGLPYKILDQNGNLKKEVAAPLTPEQKAQKEREAEERKAREEAEREQGRKDQALLDTYATPQDIDMAQKKAESDLNYAIKNAASQIEASQAKLDKLGRDAEFYKNKALPPELKKDMDKARAEIRAQGELQASKQRDLEAVRKKYEAERQRYFELTGRSSATGKPAAR